jgi:hypothetical protein
LGGAEIFDPANVIVHVDRELRLRQVDADGNWSPVGTYSTGSLLIHTWSPTVLTALTGFWAEVEEDLDVGDRVVFRLSADGGTNELFWDGGAWVTPATADDWNSEAEVDQGIASFPFDGSISFLIKLVTGDGTSTPRFSALYVWWEAQYDPTEDLIRSIHQKLVDEVAVNAELLIDIPAPGNIQIDLTADQTAPIWVPSEPIQVFKPAVDPAKQNDLFASFDGSVVTLTSAQTGELLVRYRGNLSRAHVSTDATFEREELPAVVIYNLTQDKVRDFRLAVFEEPLRSQGVVRLRDMGARHNYAFQLQCPAQWSLHDKKLADAVKRVFETREFVRSVALDENFPVVAMETANQVNRTAEQVFMRLVLVTINYWEWLPYFEDIPMAQEIRVNIHPLPATGDVEQISVE